MPTTKVSAGYKIQLPQTFLAKHRVKVGDALAIQEVNGYIILKPLQAGSESKGARPKPTRRRAPKVDRDREEWLDFSAQAFDRSFGDEPAYTSYKIKVPNPEMVKGFDEIIFQSDADFAKTGLHSDSLIRLGHLFALPKKFIEGEIGLLANKRHKRLLKTLSSYLAKKK